MKIKVSAGFTGVIATGSYENMRPSYTAEVELEIPDNESPQPIIKSYQESLQAICLGNFKQDEQKAIVDRINRERQDIRFYGDYPSVTSIIGWDDDFFISPEELREYMAQGNLIDAHAKDIVVTGKERPIKDIPGTWTDIVILKQGKLNLATEGWSFPNFLKKFPLEKMKVGEPVISKTHKYGGTPDIIAVYEKELCLCDVKRTPDKLKHFKQCAAYAKALEENGHEPFKKMMLIPLNDKTEQGFSKPIISTEFQQYFQMFLKDREAFKRRFGV